MVANDLNNCNVTGPKVAQGNSNGNVTGPNGAQNKSKSNGNVTGPKVAQSNSNSNCKATGPKVALSKSSVTGSKTHNNTSKVIGPGVSESGIRLNCQIPKIPKILKIPKLLQLVITRWIRTQVLLSPRLRPLFPPGPDAPLPGALCEVVLVPPWFRIPPVPTGVCLRCPRIDRLDVPSFRVLFLSLYGSVHNIP